VWSTVLKWQYLEQSVENHPLTLPAGSYEVVFSAQRAWLNPPRDRRALTFALSSLTFGDLAEIPPGGIDMGSAGVSGQLVSGWFEPESGEDRSYRWGGCEAAAIVRLDHRTDFVTICHRFAPASVGGLKIRLRHVHGVQPAAEAYMPWRGGGLQEEKVPVELEAGDYVMEFETGWAWTNPDQQDPTLPPDNRSLGFALASVSFGEKRVEQ
jgi:hypothetical protein